MQKQNLNREVLREKLIYCYVQALDKGDMDGVAAVLEAALDDPELDRVLAEINMTYQEEELLTPTAADAQLVRKLLREHLVSAFVVSEPIETPLTVGEIAARLQADRRVPLADQETNRHLLHSTIPVPEWLSAQAIKQLAKDLGVSASERFWRFFRDTAIMLGMGRNHEQAQLAAAREERARLRNQEQASSSSKTDTDQKKEK